MHLPRVKHKVKQHFTSVGAIRTWTQIEFLLKCTTGHVVAKADIESETDTYISHTVAADTIFKRLKTTSLQATLEDSFLKGFFPVWCKMNVFLQQRPSLSRIPQL